MTDVEGRLQPPPLVRVPHPDLSLWQSAVREAVADRVAGGNLRSPAVRAHPETRAADADAHQRHAAARAGIHPMPAGRQTALERIFELARRAGAPRLPTELAVILLAARAYSSRDPEFIVESIAKYIEWYWAGRQPEYRDWRVAGGGNIDFGVVQYRLPARARVGVIGDWGTGMDDARELLMCMLELEPTVLVHLGDIYYSGTRREDACNFADVLDEAFGEIGRRVPVFAIPGNHDYYSGGRGFYDLLGRLNPEPERQPASYFCLRSEDGGWQLVGVDTGFDDHRPGLAFDPAYVAPRLHDSEVEWLHHKLERFAGRTVLFSHHPLFSAHRAVNGPRSGRPSLNFNDALHAAVRPYLDRVAVWLWGHEHSLAIYEDGLHGLARGRLVGCSAFEVEDDPYAVRFDDVPYRQPVVRLSAEQGWYDHGFAIIDIAGAEATVDYYQFPSWAGAAPASTPPPSLLYRERLDRRS